MSRTTKQPARAILLLAHGSPDSAEEVEEFLGIVTGGRGIPGPAVEEVKRRYRLIGRSPLRETTMKQAEAVHRQTGLPVYVGMRNWTPFIGDVVRRMGEEGVGRAVAVCLAPQNSRTSVGLYRRAALEESAPPFAMEFVGSWHDEPLLIAAFARRLEEGMARARGRPGADPAVLFTAHSVPARTIEQGDPYERQARETAALVARAAAIGESGWSFAFQSQGKTAEPWLGPTVEEAILEWKRRGTRGILVQPVGFLCDHLEVLYDLDVAAARFAREEGVPLWRTESLNDSPLLAAAIAAVALRNLAAPEAPRPDRDGTGEAGSGP